MFRTIKTTTKGGFLLEGAVLTEVNSFVINGAK
jgi:hypothetical protein